MKDNNKHPHHDLIAEWIKDTRKEFQIRELSNNSRWKDSSIYDVIANPHFFARLKSIESIRELLDGGFTCLCDFKKQGGVVKVGDIISNAFEKQTVESKFDVEYYNDISHSYGHDTELFIKKLV